MGDVVLFYELAVIATVGVAVTVLLSRLQLPTVAGLLLAGALLGPYGFKLVNSVKDIEMLAEIGVIMLLFTIGLEFSLERLKHIFKQVALGGFLQVGLTILAAMFGAMALGQSFKVSLFYGFIFALSSTAIVLRALSDRRELDAPHGRFIVGTLIFQDLCVVAMMLIVPLLAPETNGSNALLSLSFALGKAALVVIATIVTARVIVPTLLDWVDASRSREVFLLAVLALCIGTAWLTHLAGLSVELGAFLAGMVVADTEYGHRAMGDMLPLRDAFVSLFFISLGMLFNIETVIEHPIWVGLLLIGFVVGKAFLATLAALAMRFPARVAWMAGIGLAQFGEFGFVLAERGLFYNIVSLSDMQPLRAAGIISMFLTPVLVRLAPHFTAGERLLAPLERLIGVKSLEELQSATQSNRTDHVVIVGYGVAGKLVAQALKSSQIPYVILELNSESVRLGKDNDEPIYYADATSTEALGHVYLKDAKALVLLMNDAQAAQRVVSSAKRIAPLTPILSRTRFFNEKNNLMKLGVADVVAEEVEGGFEVLARLLRWFDIPRNMIEQRLQEVRVISQTTERTLILPRKTLGEQADLAELKIESFLAKEGSAGCRLSAVQLDLRQQTHALVVAIKRQGQLMEDPDPNQPFVHDDIVYLVGSKDAVEKAIVLIS